MMKLSQNVDHAIRNREFDIGKNLDHIPSDPGICF